MRAISLWQPWATLVAHGLKTIETRHWRPHTSALGQTIAIHATLRTTELGLAETEPFRRALAGLDLPLGAIVGTVRLAGCTQIDAEFARELRQDLPDEFAFGNYAPGRFAWQLADAQPLAVPVTWRGEQSWFDVPDDVIAGAGVQVHPDQGSLL